MPGGWLSRNDLTRQDKLYNDMLNSLANDDRAWGGDVNAGGHHLSNVILDGSGSFTYTLSPVSVTQGADGESRLELRSGSGAASLLRWALTKDATAEAGANTGSNFALNRYKDDGTLLGTPISINRATGVITMGAQAWTGPINGGGQTISNVVISGMLADPTTTKGDLLARGASAIARLGVGTNGWVLTADSTQATGIKWAAAIGTPQTPWASDIDAATKNLFNVAAISVGYSAYVAPLAVNGLAVALSLRGTGAFTDSALGIDRIELGVNAGTPRIVLEDSGSTLWAIDNSGGVFRWFIPAFQMLTLTPTGNNALAQLWNSAGVAAIQFNTAGVSYLNGGQLAIGKVTAGYALDVVGDVNVSGGYRVAGALIYSDPLTTKGDLVGRGASATGRLGVGTDGQVLTADTASTLGVKWAAPGAGYSDPLTTKGDLVGRSASVTGRLGVGTDGQVLTADAASTLGVKWATPSVVGGGIADPGSNGIMYRTAPSVSAIATAAQIEAALTFTDITTGNVSITAHGHLPKLPNNANQFFGGTGVWGLIPIAAHTAGDYSSVLTSGVYPISVSGNQAIADIAYVIDGAGAVPATGVKGDLLIDFACTILSWTLLADQSGSAVVNVWKLPYASYPATVANKITASVPPTITTATKGQSATLTGWTTAIAVGDCLRFNLDSVTTCQRLVLMLKVTKT